LLCNQAPLEEKSKYEMLKDAQVVELAEKFKLIQEATKEL
jgi:hypothetical protein